MMNCNKAKELLSEYIDGTIEPGQKKEIDEFLKTDKECAEIFEQARLIEIKFKNLPKTLPSENFDLNLRERIIKLNKEENKQTGFTTKGLSIAFSGALMLTILYMFTITDFGTQVQEVNEITPASNINSEQPVEVIVENEEVPENDQKNDVNSDSLKNVPEEVDNSRIKLTGDQ